MAFQFMGALQGKDARGGGSRGVYGGYGLGGFGLGYYGGYYGYAGYYGDGERRMLSDPASRHDAVRLANTHCGCLRIIKGNN
jgi:hypothetical protein